MTDRNLSFAGAALLIAGLFTPIVTMPIIGTINLFNNGSNWVAICLIALAALGAAMAANYRVQDVLWPGAAAAAVLVYIFARLQYGISQMRESVATELADNPFAGLAHAAVGAVQLQWGWLVLAAGAGLLIYAGFTARKSDETGTLTMRDRTSRLVAGSSLALLIAAVAIDVMGRIPAGSPTSAASEDQAVNLAVGAAATTDAADGPTREEAAYIRQHLRLYDLDARYFDSLLDGRVPGIRFKIQNNGNRTLDEVVVRVVFFDGEGKAIAEEEYRPVLVSEYSYGRDNTPLRPNYIWQEEADKFYSAKNVPSEWATGKATATITNIEFGPNE